MDSSTVIWIVVAILVVLAVALFLWRSRGQEGAHRAKAAEIRETAAEHDRHLREQEAEATRTRAEAQLAEADAQQRQLEAERLATQADHRAQAADEVRSARDEQLRLADLHDPDVRTDDDGNRIDGATTAERVNGATTAERVNGATTERVDGTSTGRDDGTVDGRATTDLRDDGNVPDEAADVRADADQRDLRGSAPTDRRA